jgi:hypothetical protein
LRQLLPSISDFVWLMPILFLFGRMNGAPTLLGDGDTGWHIRTGEWILANGRVPSQDLFSFTKPDQSWYAWEWLSDVLMGLLHQVGGMQAVLLGAITLISLTYALLYRLVRRKSGSVLLAFALTAIAAAGSSIHWLARPHLFTMLFLVIFYSILEEPRMRLLFVLPVIAVVWTNLHGGFLAGILLTGLYAGGGAAQRGSARGRRTKLAVRSGGDGLPAREFHQSLFLASARAYDPVLFESSLFREYRGVCLDQLPAPFGTLFRVDAPAGHCNCFLEYRSEAFRLVLVACRLCAPGSALCP